MQEYEVIYSVRITGQDNGHSDLIEQADRELIEMIKELHGYLETGDNRASKVLGRIFTPTYLNQELI